MIRIALRMLVGDVVKSLGVVMGVFLSTFLVTHMLAMFTGMLQRTYSLLTDMPQADVWVMDPAVEYADEVTGMPATSLERVRGVEGVAWAVPLYTGTLRTRLPSGVFRAVQVIGLDDATLMGGPTKLSEGRLEDLRRADAVIVDRAAAEKQLRMPVRAIEHVHGRMPDPHGVETRPLAVGDELLINDHRVVVVGLAELSERFLTRVTLYTTYTRAMSLAPRERNLLSYVLVKSAEGHSASEVAARVQAATGLRARPRDEFARVTLDYFVRETGVVTRIAFMVIIGVIVGFCVTGLLLFLFTTENLRYYATFKALGASNAKLLSMIAVQAAACGVIGYGLGIGASCIVGMVTPASTMPFLLVWKTMAGVGAGVLGVCVASAALSGRLILRIEPATVFKG